MLTLSITVLISSDIIIAAKFESMKNRIMKNENKIMNTFNTKCHCEVYNVIKFLPNIKNILQ